MNKVKKTRLQLNLLRSKQNMNINQQLKDIAQFANLANKYFKIENPLAKPSFNLAEQSKQQSNQLTERIKQHIQNQKQLIELKKQGDLATLEEKMFVTEGPELPHIQSAEILKPHLSKKQQLEADYKYHQTLKYSKRDVQVILIEDDPNQNNSILFEKFQNNLKILKKDDGKSISNSYRASMFHRTFAYLLRKMKSKSSEAGSQNQIIQTEGEQEGKQQPRHIELLNKYTAYDKKHNKKNKLRRLMNLNNQTQDQILLNIIKLVSKATLNHLEQFKRQLVQNQKHKVKIGLNQECMIKTKLIGINFALIIILLSSITKNSYQQEFMKGLQKIKQMTKQTEQNENNKFSKIRRVINRKYHIQQNAQNVDDKQMILLTEDDFLYKQGHQQIEQTHGIVIENFGYHNIQGNAKKKEKYLRPLTQMVSKIDTCRNERCSSLQDSSLEYSAYQRIKKDIKLVQLNSKKYVQKLDSFQLEKLKQKLQLN